MPHRSRRGVIAAVRSVVALIAAAALAVTGSPVSAQPAVADAPVAPELQRQVDTAQAGAPVRALLMLPNPENLEGSRAEVLSTLRAHADESQAEVEIALEQRAEATADVTVLNRFWITNMLLVEFPADTQTLGVLSAVPGVQRVLPNFELTAPEPVSTAAPTAANSELAWGLDKIEADRVWNELGVNGSGVRVATLDTGVDITHPDLAGKMVTDDPADPSHPGGWMEFDSTGNRVSSLPRDSAYHGTHVAGTIHGGDTSGVAIGGAFGAGMMHGMVIPGGSGSFAQVAAGMQWAIAPTDSAGNPAGQPADVVNMSLGGNGFFNEMIAPTRAMRALDIFPAFAIGNNCGAAGTASPGNVYDSVAVGATDVDENVATFSCGGVVRKNQWADPPADWPDTYVKPNVSAPGVNIYSASPGGGYRTLSGTSMAAPHTAATAALMRSAAGELTVADIANVLGDTAFWDNRYAPAPPDTRFGVGRINAFEATRFVALNSGIRGAVTDAATGTAIEGATVTIEPGGRDVVTGPDGTFTSRVEPGTYTITVGAFGYAAATVSGVDVVADAFATADVELIAAPRGSITGTATLDVSSVGLPGVTVTVLGVPVNLSATTGPDGRYTIANVPEGAYRVAADHATFQAPAAVDVTVTAGEAVRADFAFSVPPRSVAIVDSAQSRAAKYRDVVFAPRGIATELYNWDQLDQAAQHATVVLGYGVTSNYDEAAFQAFLDATDANGTGVIFTDHAFGTGSGVKQLSLHTGQPASVGTSTGGASSAESYYEVTAEHPLLDGRQVGDRIVIDNSAQAKWVAWFDGYEGEGRQTLAGLGRTADGVLGGGIGVDQRASNRHVLLSTHGVSATRGPADWTADATELFLDAVNWASPPPDPDQPYFAVHNLRVSPDLVLADQPVTVAVDVKNVSGSAGSYDAVLRVNGEVAETTTVDIGAGASVTVDWTLRQDALGSYTVQVGHLSDSFRVRAPIVSLVASTVDAPGAAAVGPLAGATVELIDAGALVGLGSTDADGRLSFEIPDAVGRYTLVVRKPAPADGGAAYLLHREITVIDDQPVSFAPRVLSGAAAAGVGDNFAVRANLDLDSSDARHRGSVFLRPATTAPHGFRFQPGTLIASLDSYEAVTVHEVSHLEQDWWLPSRVVGGIEWIDPFDTTFSFGGAPKVDLGEVTVDEDGATTVDWTVTDAHGRPFATVLATDVRPFVDLPDRAKLEDVEGLLRAAVPNELKPILRLFGPDGAPVRAGSVDWKAQPFTFPLDPDAPDGEYRLVLEAATGGYAGTVTDEARLWVGDPATPQVSLSDTRPDTAQTGATTRYDVRAANTGTADAGPLTWNVHIGRDGSALAPRDVELRLWTGRDWSKVRLDRDASGALTGTVAGDIALTAGADQSWRVSVRFRGAGEYTVTDTVVGAGVEAANADQITVTAPERTAPRAGMPEAVGAR